MVNEVSATPSATEGFRLSPQQRHIWLLEQPERQSPYRAQCTVRVAGALDQARLEAALTQVVERHEILRTSFRCPPGIRLPVQIVDSSDAAPLEAHDLRGLPPDEQAGRIADLAASLGRSSLDIEGAATLRTALITLAANESALLIDLPALCADTTTLANLVAEIGRAYAGEGAAEQPDDQDEPIQYADVAEVFNDLLESDETAAGRQYWQQQNLSELLDRRFLFVEPPPPRHQTAPGAFAFAPRMFARPTPREVAVEIEGLAAALALQEPSIYLACWLLLLARFTGQPEVLAGVTYDGRVYEGLDVALGLFERELPLRATADPALPFVDFARQVDRAAADLTEWQEYFRLEVGEDAVEPFISFAFSFEHVPAPVVAAGLTFAINGIGATTDRFVLKLACVRRAGTLTTLFAYDANTLAAAQIERLAGQYLSVLHSVVANPHTVLCDLDIVGEEERRRLLIDLNATASPFPQDQCLHELFETQAARTFDAVSLVFEPSVVDHRSSAIGPRHLTYGELNARANQLAHRLRALGVGPEVRVGLDATRSIELIVGLLGILKAGGAYVPLDPTHPIARFASMIDDSRVRALITTTDSLRDKEAGKSRDKPLDDLLISSPGLQSVVDLRADWPMIARYPVYNPDSGVGPENLAYIIYTSGSTGRPKGVMVQHRSVVNLAGALDAAIYQERVPGLRVGMNGPATFDGSVKQLVQLLHGRSLMIVPDDVRPDGDRLLAYIRRQHVDALDCTPSQVRGLLAAGLAQDSTSDPALILVGGEATDEATWRTLAGSRSTTFVNVYGPTECTVDALVGSAPASPAEPALGRPIANVQVYLLDPHMHLVPTGLPGEIYIGGAGVARGYLNDPVMTAERFIPNPFAQGPGVQGQGADSDPRAPILNPRLYRTGDLARYLPDGQIQFIGRIDDQVKLRGLRIELGEIEAVLREHPAVRECAVAAREDSAGERRLVAYVVPAITDHPASTANEDADASFVPSVGSGQALRPLSIIDELRSLLRERLPEYMIPAAFVVLDRLPLNRHGKIDRKALPDPQAHADAAQMPYDPPRNQIEQAVAAIWAEVLQVEKVGINANFFDLGGHSLLMIQVCDKVQATFGRELSLVEMFRHPTVSALAGYLGHEPSVALRQAVDERAQRQTAARERQQQRVKKSREGG